jgi:prefoldin subunit 5
MPVKRIAKKILDDKKRRYRANTQQANARINELYVTLGKVVKYGVEDLGGREKFLGYLEETTEKLSGYEKLPMKKGTKQQVKQIIYEIQMLEKSIEQKNEPAWLRMAKSIYNRYEKK